jgi:hypothetical protein
MIKRKFIRILGLVFLFNFIISKGVYPKESKIDTVDLICIRTDDSTIYYKINNKSNKSIFIPEDYLLILNRSSDTINFDYILKYSVDTIVWYYYKNLFPFDFSTPVEIQGYKSDSIYLSIVYESHHFGDLPKLTEIPTDSFYIGKMTFKIPPNMQYVKARIFRTNVYKEWLNNYSLEDYNVIELMTSYFIESKIYYQYGF